MPVGAKLAILLYICLILNYPASQANPPGVERSTRTKNDVYDWLSSLFGEYDDDDSDSREEYLICRNCTVIVGQANATETTAAPVPVAPTTPDGVFAPVVPTAAPPPDNTGGPTPVPTDANSNN